MAIKKKLIHFNFSSVFNAKKLSANDKNTNYTVGPESTEVLEGSPDILYQSIVFIKDIGKIWTHGKIYGSIEEASLEHAGLMSAQDKSNLDTLVQNLTWS